MKNIFGVFLILLILVFGCKEATNEEKTDTNNDGVITTDPTNDADDDDLINTDPTNDDDDGVITTDPTNDADAESVAFAKDSLTFDTIKNLNTNENNVTSSLILPLSGADSTTIEWSSNNPSINAISGSVVRPLYSSNDTSVTLTADITKGIKSDLKSFYLTVLKESHCLGRYTNPSGATIDFYSNGSCPMGYMGSTSSCNCVYSSSSVTMTCVGGGSTSGTFSSNCSGVTFGGVTWSK